MPMRKLIIGFAVTLMFLIVVVSQTQAASVQVSWQAPTTNADGTPLTDLAGYKL